MHYNTEKTKQKISESKNSTKKQVQCIETGIVYNSLAEASKASNTDISSISKVCKGLMNSAGGYHWQFPDRPIKILKDNRFKPVLCINTNIAYKTVSEAALKTNSDPSNIAKVCNGKYKTTNKLKWKYISLDEYNKIVQGEYDEED